MLDTSSVRIFSGSLNVKWTVRPHSQSVAAMPDEATARSISLTNLTFAHSKFIRNIFPVPPGASRKTFEDNITS